MLVTARFAQLTTDSAHSLQCSLGIGHLPSLLSAGTQQHADTFFPERSWFRSGNGPKVGRHRGTGHQNVCMLGDTVARIIQETSLRRWYLGPASCSLGRWASFPAKVTSQRKGDPSTQPADPPTYILAQNPEAMRSHILSIEEKKSVPFSRM